MQRKGSGWKGSGDLLTSVANQEVCPSIPVGQTHGFSFYKFSFINKQACHVKINGGDRIFLDIEQGFESEDMDADITSLVIEEAGIQYQWIGAY